MIGPAMRAAVAALMVTAAGPAAAACAPGAVEIRLPAGGTARFSVDLADTPEERARGLMFVEHMAMAQGMLFLYESPQHASFWMKNTKIPLDMIFADAAGRVTRVHPQAVPGDLTPIDGGEGVLAVLEINGGLAARMGIAPGAVIRHPALDQSRAAWPCAE